MTDNAIKDHIDRAIKNGTLSQAYIFEGADDKAKISLAMHMAKTLLCTGDGSEERPCGKCRSCALIDSGNHPDCIVVTHEKPSTIAVDEIREQVVGDIAIRPYYGGRKIYIIPDAGLMRTEGQNALLKTIEEPPAYAVIIFTVKNKELLLETIRSRCITLSFTSEPEFWPEDEGLMQQFERIGKIISGRDGTDTAELMSFAKELAADDRESLQEFLSYIERICRDGLLAKSGIYLTEGATKGYIEKTAEIPYEGFEKILKAVEEARHDIQINVAAEAVLDVMLLRICQAVGGA